MISKIVPYAQVISKIAEVRQAKKIVILVTGAFDLITLGHINFLKKIKTPTNILIVGIETDQTVKNEKGASYPLNKLKYRLEFLAELTCVDWVFGLPEIMPHYANNRELYVARLKKLNPSAIAIPQWDPNLEERVIQAKIAGIKTNVVKLSYQNHW